MCASLAKVCYMEKIGSEKTNLFNLFEINITSVVRVHFKKLNCCKWLPML